MTLESEIYNSPAKFFSIVLLAVSLVFSASGQARADSYDNVWMECHYITQCSMSEANVTVKNVPESAPGYGAINDWRIGNGAADSVDCGTEGIGMVGLLYGHHRLMAAGRSNSELDDKANATCKAFFWDWITNRNNKIQAAGETGFPSCASYDTSGSIRSISGPSAGVTAQLLIAMSKYRQLSDLNDGARYGTAEYKLALEMGEYINHHVSSWTVDRSYAVASFRALSHWATAMGDASSSRLYSSRADAVSNELAQAQDLGPFKNYFNYLTHHGVGMYDGGNVDQTGFSPYEFNARPPKEAYASEVANWWDHGKADSGLYLTVQSGPYTGGVHQAVPKYADRSYPGDSFQLADTEWKIARTSKQKGVLLKEAWSHYNFALSPLGSNIGSGCWTNVTTTDTFIGGFIDWVDDQGNRPANWQRYVDTSAYMIVATEELVFSSEVDWSK